MNASRRQFVAVAGSGLVLGWPPEVDAEAATAQGQGPGPGPGLAQPFLRIGSDGTVTVITKHLEMGQGIASGLATVLADALDADWSRVRTEAAPVNPALYKNLVFGMQSTGGSTSMANSWSQLRAAGATARAMLMRAAAQRWALPPDQIDTLSTKAGWVLHAASAQRASYGDLAAAAAAQPVPADASPAPSRLVGMAVPRLGVADIARGTAQYGMDLARPGLRVALLMRPPRFGATVAGVDDAAARTLPGVRGVHRLPQGVAVVADSSWAAIRARRATKVQWDDSAAEQRSTNELFDAFKRLADAGEPGVDGLARGDAAAALAAAPRTLEAEFELPYLAHQAMEPLAAMAEMLGGQCHIWAASQNPQADHAAAMRILNLPADRVLLHGLPAGGSFGRRATFSADWVTDLLQVWLAHGTQQPLKLMWTREDDIASGFYRPMALHRIRAGLSAEGRIVGVQQTIVAQSFLFPPPAPGKAPRHDPTATEGHMAGRYDVPAAQLRWVQAATGVPVQMYRALSFNHTTFTKEVLMDELSRAAGQDAVAFRLAHLAGHPRQAAVLRAAAARAGWGRPQAPGRALGVAVQEAEKSHVAQIARVRLDGGRIVVEHVVCVIDCGLVVNPGTVRAQMEGGIGFGLTQALMSEITLDAGRVLQSNFHDAPVLRMAAMPSIDVMLMPSAEPPTGVGEPGSVPIVAAVANAVAQLTGQRVRRLPLRLSV